MALNAAAGLDWPIARLSDVARPCPTTSVQQRCRRLERWPMLELSLGVKSRSASTSERPSVASVDVRRSQIRHARPLARRPRAADPGLRAIVADRLTQRLDCHAAARRSLMPPAPRSAHARSAAAPSRTPATPVASPPSLGERASGRSRRCRSPGSSAMWSRIISSQRRCSSRERRGPCSPAAPARPRSARWTRSACGTSSSVLVQREAHQRDDVGEQPLAPTHRAPWTCSSVS